MDEIMKKCKFCGKEYPATLEYFRKHNSYRDRLESRCKNCSRERDRIAWERKGGRQRNAGTRNIQGGYGKGRNHNYYEILADPDDRGGFPSGALLDSYNLNIALTMGHMTPGAVLQSKYGYKYKVIGEAMCHQKIVAMKEEVAQ